MSNNFDKIELAESISAIKQYFSKKGQNVDRHKANILVHSKRKDYGPEMRMVSATMNGDIGRVIIEDLHTIYGGCSNTFTTQDCSFSFVAGTLCLKVKDGLFGEISINIT